MENNLNQLSTKNLPIKIIFANLIDIGIPLTPLLYSYYYKDLVIFEYLNLFQLLGIVYLIFNLLAYNFGKGCTIGENLIKIQLIDVKTKKKNHFKNIFRIVFIAALLFYSQEGDSFKYESIAVLFFMIVPVKFSFQNNTIYSIVNNFLKISYRNNKIATEIVKENISQ